MKKSEALPQHGPAWSQRAQAWPLYGHVWPQNGPGANSPHNGRVRPQYGQGAETDDDYTVCKSQKRGPSMVPACPGTPQHSKEAENDQSCALKQSKAWPCTVPAHALREHIPSKAEKRMLAAATCLLGKVRRMAPIWPSRVPACLLWPQHGHSRP